MKRVDSLNLPVTRRQLLLMLGSFAVLGCSSDRDLHKGADPVQVAEFDRLRVETLQPFRTPDLALLGRRVRELDPGAEAHAIRKLTPLADSESLETRIDFACRSDVAAGEVLTIDDWRAPRTLCGIAAALA